MLVFVDLEHAEGYKSEWGSRMLAARTTITYRLEDLSGRHCHLVRYSHVDEALLDAVEAEAIFISGNSIGLDDYPAGDLDQLIKIVAKTQLPVFGFCGGFQLVARALGADVVPIKTGPEQVEDESIISMNNSPFEFGYFPVKLAAIEESGEHPLLADLGPDPVFRHAHGLHVPQPPEGFATLASTAVTPVQLAVNDERRILGTQFHPEYWTDEHPAGRALIVNFMRWAGLLQG